jgi:hypothetical protein
VEKSGLRFVSVIVNHTIHTVMSLIIFFLVCDCSPVALSDVNISLVCFHLILYSHRFYVSTSD